MSVAGVTWTGVDGSAWDLTGGGQGVVLAGGVSGLHLPVFTQQKSTAARVPGQRYQGTVWSARDVVLSVHVTGGDPVTGKVVGDAWRAVDAAWWASLSPEAPGTLTVTTSSGSRSLSCRLGAAADPGFAVDPAMQGHATYGLTLTADQPFYTGPDTSTVVALPPQPPPYYGGAAGTGYGPPFFIAPSSPAAGAKVANPGDRPAYSRWLFTGPGQFTFTIGGHTTTLPTLAAGQVVSIDTDPTRSGAVLDVTGGGAVNFWPFLGAHDFWAPIPARTTGYPVPVVFAGGAYGLSQAQATVTPMYSRAW